MTTRTAWRSVRPDFRSSHGYRWPFPGNTAVPPLPDGAEFTRGGPCPQFVGDGLCLAKTWRGAASGGIPAVTCLLVEFGEDAVLGEDDDKVRVTRCRVVDVFDAPALIRDGWCAGADLYGADLYGADLNGADLNGAYLNGADLYGADLNGANLYGATLNGANLYRADLNRADLNGAYLNGANLNGADLYGATLNGANLYGATLNGADLYGADLYGATLNGADLYRATLNGADLNGADLNGADLYGADLNGAKANPYTRWPDGFDPKTAGVLL